MNEIATALASLAPHLQDMRLKRGWSEAVLARKADLPEQTIREYEADPSKLTVEVSSRVHHALTRRRASWRPSTQSELWTNGCLVEAALNIDQARFRDALKVFEKALIPDLSPECIGRLLLVKAAVLGELGWEARALETLQQAELCLGPGEKEPSVWLRLRLDQLYFLCHADQFCEADALLAETRELAADEGTLPSDWSSPGWKGVSSRGSANGLRPWISSSLCGPSTLPPVISLRLPAPLSTQRRF